ncbi:MAG: CPBP family intramembrane glutamic endopeptidase [Chlamydiota bacterium]
MIDIKTTVGLYFANYIIQDRLNRYWNRIDTFTDKEKVKKIEHLTPRLVKFIGNVTGQAHHISHEKIGISKKLLTNVTGPITEECIFRGIIQEVILRQTPRALLKTIGKNPQVIDLFPCAVLRVIVSSGIFALIHDDALEVNYCLPQLFGGLMLGGIMEAAKISSSDQALTTMVVCSLLHGLHNYSSSLKGRDIYWEFKNNWSDFFSDLTASNNEPISTQVIEKAKTLIKWFV